MNRIKYFVMRLESIVRPAAYGVAIAAVYSMIGTRNNSLTGPNQNSGPADVIAKHSNYLLGNLSRDVGADQSSSLAGRIREYDEALKAGDFNKLYELRSERWKAVVSKRQAEQIFKQQSIRVSEIYTLAVDPLSKLSGDATPGYVVARLAVLETSERETEWTFYLETWIKSEERISLVGGAPWDQPALPVLRVSR